MTTSTSEGGPAGPAALAPGRGVVGTVAAAALACIVLTLLAIAFVDRPTATWAHASFHDVRQVFHVMQLLPEWLFPVAAVALAAAALMLALGRPIAGLLAILVRCSLALIAAEAVKNQLKYAFGRTWPETWTNNNPSWIKDGMFGFFPFHGGQGWASFPSGHTTATLAVVACLWVLLPRLRPLWGLAAIVVVVGLVGADYHWVSDIVAGAFLGTAAGLVAARLRLG